MKHVFWAYGLIALGIAILVGLRFVNDLTTTSEADYYTTKEIMEAAMLDSVDYGVYRRYGDLRIIKEKFIENFIKRFSEEVKGSKTYSIEFREIYEDPIKATVLVKTSTGGFQVSSDTTLDTDIYTRLSGIVETKYIEDCIQKGKCRDEDAYGNGSSGGTQNNPSNNPSRPDNNPSNPTENTDEVNKYTVNVNVTGGTTSSPSKNVTSGGNVTFTINPSSGYKLEGATVSGGCTLSGITLTASNVTSDITCNVTLTKIQKMYTVWLHLMNQRELGSSVTRKIISSISEEVTVAENSSLFLSLPSGYYIDYIDGDSAVCKNYGSAIGVFGIYDNTHCGFTVRRDYCDREFFTLNECRSRCVDGGYCEQSEENLWGDPNSWWTCECR